MSVEGPSSKASDLREENVKQEELPIKRDPHGFPLRPQPTDDALGWFKDLFYCTCTNISDPLNWPAWLKLVVLIQVSFLAFLGPFCQAVINAALLPLSEDLGISVTEASYQTTVPIVFAGVFPLLWSPLSNIYGRRPIFIFVSALGIASQCAAAVASTWSGILTARAFVGIGTSAGMGIGAAVVADMYFMHERGKYVLGKSKSLVICV